MAVSNPEDVRIEPLANGAQIVRGPDGKFLPGTRPPNPITAANARELNQKRQEKAAKSAAAGMTAGVRAGLRKCNPDVRAIAPSDFDNADEFDAWAVLNAATALQVMASDIPRPEAIEMLGHNSRLAPRRAVDQDDPAAVSLNLSPDALRELLSALTRAHDDRIVGGQARDA
jgi:hypothetical protein